MHAGDLSVYCENIKERKLNWGGRASDHDENQIKVWPTPKGALEQRFSTRGNVSAQCPTLGRNGQALDLHNAQSLAGAIQVKHALKVLQLEAVI